MLTGQEQTSFAIRGCKTHTGCRLQSPIAHGEGLFNRETPALPSGENIFEAGRNAYEFPLEMAFASCNMAAHLLPADAKTANYHKTHERQKVASFMPFFTNPDAIGDYSDYFIYSISCN